jgi:hypothetical protein
MPPPKSRSLAICLAAVLVAFAAGYSYRTGVEPLALVVWRGASAALFPAPLRHRPVSVEIPEGRSEVCFVMFPDSVFRRICVPVGVDALLHVARYMQRPVVYQCPSSGRFYWTPPYLCSVMGDVGGLRVGAR